MLLKLLFAIHIFALIYAGPSGLKAGQLGAIESLLSALKLHGNDVQVARSCAQALWYICRHGHFLKNFIITHTRGFSCNKRANTSDPQSRKQKQNR